MGFKPNDTMPGYQEANKRGHIETAMEYLEEFTGLSPACLDAIRYCVEDKDMRLASIPSKTHILRGYKKNGRELFGVELNWKPRDQP